MHILCANYRGPLDTDNVRRIETRHLERMLAGETFRALDDSRLESRKLSDEGRALVRAELERRK